MALPYLSETEERRLVLRVLAYWQDIRGDRRFPAMTDVSPDVVGTDWQNCALLDVNPSDAGVRLAFAGRNLGALGLETPVPDLAPVPDVTGILQRMIRQALGKDAPICTGREFLVRNEKCLGRIIVLPLSASDGAIDGFVVAMNWIPVACAADDAEYGAGGVDRQDTGSGH